MALAKTKLLTLDLNPNTLVYTKHRLTKAGCEGEGEVDALEQNIFTPLPQSSV
ncbi:hypothetical protein C8Q74DRAFT_1310343 [Fomes fomentarius]|nr:hypothetical protein C8Q74DRAFT_1310343 [Fomes fomentarius]